MALTKDIERPGQPTLSYHRIGAVVVRADAPMISFTLESYVSRQTREKVGAPDERSVWHFPLDAGADLLPACYNALKARPDWTDASDDGNIETTGGYLAMAMPIGSARWTDGAWDDGSVFTLDAAKALAWQRIKQSRVSALTQPIVTPHGTFDGSLASQQNIMKAWLRSKEMLALGRDADVAFTLADNTRPTFTAAQFNEVAVIMGDRETDIYNTAAALRQQIDAATTPEAALAVVWPA